MRAVNGVVTVGVGVGVVAAGTGFSGLVAFSILVGFSGFSGLSGLAGFSSFAEFSGLSGFSFVFALQKDRLIMRNYKAM